MCVHTHTHTRDMSCARPTRATCLPFALGVHMCVNVARELFVLCAPPLFRLATRSFDHPGCSSEIWQTPSPLHTIHKHTHTRTHTHTHTYTTQRAHMYLVTVNAYVLGVGGQV